jgi:hypothetical protein
MVSSRISRTVSGMIIMCSLLKKRPISVIASLLKSKVSGFLSGGDRLGADGIDANEGAERRGRWQRAVERAKGWGE